MKDIKSLKRLALIYAALIACFGFLIIYIPTKCLAPMDSEVARLQEEENTRLSQAAVDEKTISGDVYDCNNRLICQIDQDTGEYVWSNNTIYSNILGTPGDGNGLLLDNLQKILKTPDGNTDKGDSLVLTLDSELQEEICGMLADGAGDRSSAVVLDAQSGAILAMGYYPSYDITEDSPDSAKTVTPLLYPWRPGSIFKVVTGVGINEQGWENETITDSGSYALPSGGTIYNDGVNKENASSKASNPKTRDFYSGFEYSSNVYFGQMAYRLGWDSLTEIASRFLIGEQEIPFEFGRVNSTFESECEPYDKSSPNLSLARIGYGYGALQLTTLQAAMITQAIANDGAMCMPYMLDEVKKTVGVSLNEGYSYELGETIEDINIVNWHKNQEPVTVTDADTARNIRNAMKKGYAHTKYAYELTHDPIEGLNETGIEVDGTTYSIACKTGTADISDDGGNAAWIISMAPADDPQYIVVVSRYNVPEKTYGNSVLEEVAAIYQKLFSEQ